MKRIQPGKAILASFIVLAAASLLLSNTARQTTAGPSSAEIDRLCRQVEPKVIEWRRDIHEHPELGNTEFRTSKLVAEHLKKLGLEVKTGVAITGVVGILKGGRPGRVIALRADMDALPVKEMTGLSFASKAKSVLNGQEVDVMHACGHDAHTAVLMGAAEVLAAMRESLPGTVVFIFQPAEDGLAAGTEGGARVMVREGVLDNPRPEAVLGLHVMPRDHGALLYRAGGFMASSNTFHITVKGRQTHGSQPWAGIDTVVTSAQIILGLQTIVSRQIDITAAPAVITVGMLRAGVQTNIIPQEVKFSGTIRTLDPAMRRDILDRVRKTAESIAKSAGAEAEVEILEGLPVVVNDAALVRRLLPALERATGKDLVREIPPATYSEDFAYYAEKVPGFFFFLGINAQGADPAKVFPVHSPFFMIDESALVTGVRAFASMVFEFL